MSLLFLYARKTSENLMSGMQWVKTWKMNSIQEMACLGCIFLCIQFVKHSNLKEEN